MEAARRMGRMVSKKPPKKPPPKTDKAQSERFKELAKELEADGDLNITEAREKFEQEIGKLVKTKATPTSAAAADAAKNRRE